MPLMILPAIDVAEGNVARSVAGTSTAAGDPVAVATEWQADGAEWLHLVDLDAAHRRGSNRTQLASVIEHAQVQVELSGGIWGDESLAAALGTSADRIVLACDALADLDWCARAIERHGERLAVALDVDVDNAEGPVGGRLTPRGSALDLGDLWECVGTLNSAGCRHLVVTDVRTDGALAGPNLALQRAVAERTDAQVIASGGVAALDDLIALAGLATDTNVAGAIVGSALLGGRFTLPEALAAVAAV